ncbi:MAG TPA: DHHA1 domain-containing protein [Vicinamibacterales bacterium]|nr:DHHA1 domain-containing protein [Vicinamibacterales bacterium]
MTTRLYYAESTLRTFDATVVSCDRRADHIEVVLDRTAFYPTSGGQPFDTGTLGAARVLDVVEREDGEIAHVVSDALPAGARVAGEIDWPRRFDHMQQHTGQHVLSAACDRLLQVRTVSFHLGAISSTIDLAREISPKEIERVEAESNRIVWEDRPVSIRFADEEEAARLPLRKEPTRGGRLRLIDVEQFDLSACGGTHVARTGAIGVIAVSGWEKFRGGSRVEFVCGGRALHAHRQLRDTIAASIRLLSVLPQELPGAIERLQNDGKEQRRRVKDLQTELAGHQAGALAAAAETIGNARVVIASLEGWDAPGLKTIASAIVERPGHVAILVSSPAPAAIVIARASDQQVDSAALLKQIVARFGGKGGGRPELAQGGGLDAPAAALVSAARSLLQPS